MLHPSMTELLEKVDNRYLLVNVAAKRAREIAENAELSEIKLTEKPVKLALDDIISRQDRQHHQRAGQRCACGHHRRIIRHERADSGCPRGGRGGGLFHRPPL